MKNLLRLLGIAALVAAIGFSMIACDNGGGGSRPNPNPNPNPTPGGDSELSGTISITPTGPVTVGDQLTAVYSGNETVSYQWKRGTTNVGTNSDAYTPDQAGSYTVTVRATGYVSKTSTAVTVNEPVGELAFELINNGTAYRVRKGTLTGGEVIIPASYNGKPVTEIGSASDSYSDGAFSYGLSSFTSVTIPSSVTSIGSYAFYYCTGITSVTIPNSVTYIGTGAFYATSITSITIPSGVTTIFNGTFMATDLTSVTIPNSVTTIGGNGDTESNEIIGGGAFQSCTNLTSVTIPASVTSIDADAFRGCTSLTSITVAAGNPSYSSEGGILYNNTKTELIAYPSASGNVTIPSGVTSIGQGAFSLNTSLTGVTIPSNVTTIRTTAFFGCTGITSITIPSSVTTVGVGAFGSWTDSQTINVPFANASAAPTGWSIFWNLTCDAVIKYWNGSTWI